MKIALCTLMILNIIIYAILLNFGAVVGWGLALTYYLLWENEK